MSLIASPTGKKPLRLDPNLFDTVDGLIRVVATSIPQEIHDRHKKELAIHGPAKVGAFQSDTEVEGHSFTYMYSNDSFFNVILMAEMWEVKYLDGHFYLRGSHQHFDEDICFFKLKGLIK
jgi:hypothetical protein